MAYEDLDPQLSVQAFKHVTLDVGSPLADPGSRFLKDQDRHFLVLEQTGQDEVYHQHVGFVALKRDEFGEMPSHITLADSAEATGPETNVLAPNSLDIFNCQEVFYSLSDPKSHRFGLYAFDLQDRSHHLNLGQLARMMFRLGLAVARQRDLVGSARQEHAKRNEKLSKQAKKELIQQEMASNPVMPTLGVRRMLLDQGSLQRLGIVTDIYHNSGKRR